MNSNEEREPIFEQTCADLLIEPERVSAEIEAGLRELRSLLGGEPDVEPLTVAMPTVPPPPPPGGAT